MKRFLIVLPATLVLIWLALIFESTAFALLAFTAVAFAVLSFIWLTLTQRGIKVQLQIPARVADRGQEIGLKVTIQNKSIFPVGKIKLFLAYGENQMIKTEKRVLKLSDVLRGKTEAWERFAVFRSGYYDFKVKKIQIFDPLGLFYVTRRRKSVAHVMVLPKLEEVPVKLGDSVKHFYGETMDYDEDHPGKDSSEVFGVREFQEGDKLQRIHWKLSARMDDLMVKEDSLPKSCAVVLFMPESTADNGEMLDYAASLSFSLMDAKCAHFVAWQSKSRSDVMRMRVTDEESFYEALTTYMQDVSPKLEEDCMERYKEKYKGEQFLHGICAFANGTLVIDGEAAGGIEEVRKELFLK